jgi:hypothetical protein
MGANDPHAFESGQPAEKGFPWFSVGEGGKTQTVQQSAGLPRSNFDFQNSQSGVQPMELYRHRP